MASCPVCANQANVLVEKRGTASILRCSRCLLDFADPLDYSTGYYDAQYAENLSLLRMLQASRSALRKKARSLAGAHTLVALEWLKRHLPPSSPVLDIGCGSGAFLALLEEQGFTAVGVEVAKEPVDILRQKGFLVHLGSVDSYPADWPTPKAVTLFEVIEHLSDPVRFLQTVRKTFPHAPLLLSTPNPHRWTLRLGWREREDYPPNHLLRWSLDSLRLALSRAEYAQVEFRMPKVQPREVCLAVADGLLFALKLKGVQQGPPQRSARRAWVRTWLTRLRSPIIWLYDRSVELSTVAFFPLAAYANCKGWPSQSVVAIALPPTGTPVDQSGI